MVQRDIESILHQLLELPVETEWVEFKHAEKDFHFDDIGRYFSALSNESNLKNKQCGWLIFGVSDIVPRQIRGF